MPRVATFDAFLTAVDDFTYDVDGDVWDPDEFYNDLLGLIRARRLSLGGVRQVLEGSGRVVYGRVFATWRGVDLRDDGDVPLALVGSTDGEAVVLAIEPIEDWELDEIADHFVPTLSADPYALVLSPRVVDQLMAIYDAFEDDAPDLLTHATWEFSGSQNEGPARFDEARHRVQRALQAAGLAD